MGTIGKQFSDGWEELTTTIRLLVRDALPGVYIVVNTISHFLG